jgi:hypothetical protein
MRVAFCIPGPTFSGWFLENWTRLIQTLPRDVEWKLFRNYNPNVHVVRNQVLERARMFRPDYYMWIDSDINFAPDNFYRLLTHSNVDIVSGIYVMKTTYPYNDFACGKLDGGTLTREDVKGKTDLIEVKANGLGWMLVKGEVFEQDRLEQPFTQDDHGTGEDALFQMRAKELGYRSYIDPTLIVGHEKMMILT